MAFAASLRLVLVVGILGLGATGCGYSLRGQGRLLPDGMERLAVPLLRSNGIEPRFETIMTDALRRQLERNPRLILVDEATADAVLLGVIEDYRQLPQQVNAQGIVQEYQFSLTMSLAINLAEGGEEIFSVERRRLSEWYPVDENFESRIDVQEAAWEEACEDFAETLVNEMLSGF